MTAVFSSSSSWAAGALLLRTGLETSIQMLSPDAAEAAETVDPMESLESPAFTG